MKKCTVIPVILCGGSGSRLWPLSRAAFPKQFLSLIDNSSLFQNTLHRLRNFDSKDFKLDTVIIVTNEEYRFLVLDQIRNYANFSFKLILEPCSKNTAPAITLAALEALCLDKEAILIALPSDQAIQNDHAFFDCLKESISVAKDNAIGLLGINPDRPDTGYGYIKKKADSINKKYFEVLNFKEKPSLKQANLYLESGDYLWNSGIFIMKANVWLKVLAMTNIEILDKTKKAFQSRTFEDLFIRPNDKLFKKIPSESIDYAVIEKIIDLFPIKVIQLDVNWNDLGSWSALWKISNKDKNNNAIRGDNILHKTKNSLVFSNSRLVVTFGVENLIIVETDDAILVSNKDDAENLKELTKELTTRGELKSHRKIFRPWGWFDNLDEGINFKVKRIQVSPHSKLSLQKHKHRAEHWIVVKGEAKIICGNNIFFLKENESTYIPHGEIHQLCNPGSDLLEIIEVQSGNYLGEDDIERFEDSYGRALKNV
jgi:mannose-1-phosphate guanylyltransferase/mannose-6-phosphate isomerase